MNNENVCVCLQGAQFKIQINLKFLLPLCFIYPVYSHLSTTALQAVGPRRMEPNIRYTRYRKVLC